MGIQAVISQKCSQAHEKEEKKKLEIERFLRNILIAQRKRMRKTRKNAEFLSLQPQWSSNSTIDLTEESSPKLETESNSTKYQQNTIDHGIYAGEV